MPTTAAVSYAIHVSATTFGGPAGSFIALMIAGAIDAYIMGSLLAPDSIDQNLGKQNLNIRSASEPHKIVYGRTMTGGTVVFLDVLDRYKIETAGTTTNCTPFLKESRSSGDYLNMAIAVAAHEIDAFEEVWIGEDKVFETDVLTGTLNLVSSKYKNYIEFIGVNGNQTSHETFIKANVDKHYEGGSASPATNVTYYASNGIIAATSTTMTLDTDRIYNSVGDLTYSGRTWVGTPRHGEFEYCSGTMGAPGGKIETFNNRSGGGKAEPPQGRPWTASYKLTNTAYAYFRFRYNPDLYKGVPKARVVIRGKKVYDPRLDSGKDNYIDWDPSGNYIDRGDWAPSTNYNINDWITDPDSNREYICIESHLSDNSAWGTGVFQKDFIIGNYWKQVSTRSDPSKWVWSDNWALCVRDYLTSGCYHSVLANLSYTRPVNLYGVGIKDSEIDEDNIIEAANVSDEKVYLSTTTETVSTQSYNSSTNRQTVTVVGDITDYYVKHENIQITTALGTAGDLINSGVLAVRYSPASPFDLDTVLTQVSTGLYSIEKVYYTSNTNKTTIQFRSAQDLNPIGLRIWSNRFTINGIVDTSNSPISTLENLLAAGAGKLPYAQGKFLVIPGVYIIPAIHIDESNLAGAISVQGSLPASELINTITGTCKNAAAFWEETDFPKQTDSSYIEADGGYELIQNVKYPFTTSNFDAQRLARISLQRAREGVSCTILCNLSAMEILIGAFITVSIARLGWTDKVFSVTSWSYQEGKINLGLREENPVAYDWTDILLEPIIYSPDTDFDVAPDLNPLTDLTMNSGTSELISLADGTIVPRVRVSWTAPEQDLQTYILFIYQLQPFDLDDLAITSREIRINDPDQEEYYIDEVREGDVLTITGVVRYDDPNMPNESDEATVLNHTVIGKSEPPIDVTGFTSAIEEDLLVLSWTANTEIDFSHYEIQVGGTAWDTGTSIVGTTTSATYIVTGLNVSADTYRVKAVDTSGNKSSIEATTVPDITGPNAIADVTYTIQQSNIALFWGSAPKGTFPVANYEIRHGNDPIFINNTLVAIVDSTDYIITDLWLGTRTYRVVAKDIYGNSNTQTTETIIIAAPSSPTINPYILNGDKVEFTWDTTVNSLTQFSIQSYEISHGTDPVWDNNTFVLTTGTDGFSRRVDWLNSVEPTRTFRVRAVDYAGNVGSVNTVNVTITEPGATTINKQVIDNNILFTWAEPTIIQDVHLPINFYEIRKGDSYGVSEHIGNISGLFAAIFETISGTFTYWITAVDTAGNPGTNNNITAVINQPPDYSLLVNASDDFSTIDSNWLSRTFLNAFATSVDTVIMPVDLTENWTDHFVDNSWTNIEDQENAGFPIYIQPTPATGSYQIVYALGSLANNLSITSVLTSQIIAGNPIATLKVETAIFNAVPSGTNDTLDATGITLHDTGASFTTTTSVGSVVTNTTEGSTATITSVTDDTHIVMSAGLTGGTTDDQWQTSDAYTIENWIERGTTITDSLTAFVDSFEFVRVTIDVASSLDDTDIYELSSLNIIVDVKEITDSGSSITDSTPDNFVTVNFNKSFMDIISIVVTPNIVGGDNIVAVYDFVDSGNPTSFDVYTFNGEDGSEAYDVNFSWVARGY